MIVINPIGPIKIGNMVCRLTVGKQVPDNVMEFWNKNNTTEKLLKLGVIEKEKENRKELNDKPVRESKSSKSKDIKQTDGIFDTGNDNESSI